jgi:hypothetical protein
MRYLDRIRRLERRFPAPLPEVVVRWGDSKGKPFEIFSTKGWKIAFDENGVFTKTGDVPDEFGEHRLQPPIKNDDSQSCPRAACSSPWQAARR